MTGFKLTWFIQAKNGTRVTEELPARAEDWKPIAVSPTYGTDELLNKSVQLASQWKLKNMTEEEMIGKIVQTKGIVERQFCSLVVFKVRYMNSKR